MQRGSPKPIDFGWNDHLSHENLFIWVNRGVVFHFLPVHLLFVNFVYSRPLETIVKIEPVNFELLNNLNTLIDQQIPRLLLSVVQRSGVIMADWFSIGTVVEYDSSVFVDCLQPQSLVSFAHVAWADPWRAVYNDLDI